MTLKASPLNNLKNFTRLMTLKASPLGNLKKFTRLMTLKASPLGNRGGLSDANTPGTGQ